MKHASMPRLMAPVVVACSLFAAQAEASTRAVNFNVLNASATLASPLNAGDTLVQNTLVISEVGALLQNITFSLASGVEALTGYAAWQISTAAGTGPRLIGVNIDLFDAGNTLVTSDTFVGTLGGFAQFHLQFGHRPGHLQAGRHRHRSARLVSRLVSRIHRPHRRRAGCDCAQRAGTHHLRIDAGWTGIARPDGAAPQQRTARFQHRPRLKERQP